MNRTDLMSALSSAGVPVHTDRMRRKVVRAEHAVKGVLGVAMRAQLDGDTSQEQVLRKAANVLEAQLLLELREEGIGMEAEQ